LDFSLPLIEKTNNVNQSLFTSNGDLLLGLQEFKELIEQAKGDSEIKGILISGEENVNGFATTQSIVEALKDFKSSGKFIYAYGDGYSQSGYLLSSIADSIFLNPNGEIGIKGLALSYPFFKGAFEKLGVDFNIFYAGNFKSATEPFRRTDMSPENKLQSREFIGDMFKVFSKLIEENRGIDKNSLDKIINEQLGRNSKLALANRLVDRIVYWDELLDLLRSKVDKNSTDRIKFLSLDKYRSNSINLKKGSYGKDKIALLYAEGDVVYGSDEKGTINNVTYLKTLEKIRKDKKIKAVVLRVNSGGGSALTSDIIWRELELIRKSGKPVIASLGDYAASGGYYIACGADSIVAMESTLTGSIGVFSMLPNAKNLLKDKMGITFDSVLTHKNAVQMSLVYQMTDAEKVRLQESTDAIYEQFLDRVSIGRQMPKVQVHKYAQGRIWSGIKAKEIGLVDELGDLKRAVEIAASKAKLKDYALTEYPKVEENNWEVLLREIMSSQKDEDAALKFIKTELSHIIKLKNLAKSKGVQAVEFAKLEFQ
jgi:protease-4